VSDVSWLTVSWCWTSTWKCSFIELGTMSRKNTVWSARR